jgi:hypothetical protein
LFHALISGIRQSSFFVEIPALRIRSHSKEFLTLEIPR